MQTISWMFSIENVYIGNTCLQEMNEKALLLYKYWFTKWMCTVHMWTRIAWKEIVYADQIPLIVMGSAMGEGTASLMTIAHYRPQHDLRLYNPTLLDFNHQLAMYCCFQIHDLLVNWLDVWI